MLSTKLVRQWRDTGTVDADLVHRLQTHSFDAYQLSDTSKVRTELVKHVLDVDRARFVRMAKAIQRSPFAGKRIGKEWLPPSASEIVTRKTDSDDSWVTREQLRPLDDVCTKWCTKTYFPNAFSRVTMICNMMRMYNLLAKDSKLSFQIIFKGGVMIRLVLMQLLRDLPIHVRRTMMEYFKTHKVLSISDLDFEIVPDDHRSPPDLVHRYFALDYAVLLWFQSQLQRELEEGSPQLLSLAWKEGEERTRLKEMLQEAVDELDDASHPLHQCTIDAVGLSSRPLTALKGYRTRSGKAHPRPRDNVCVFECRDAGRCVMKAHDYFRALRVDEVPATSGGERLYATLNTYIGEDTTRTREEEFISIFHLARIKHAFVVYYTTSTGEKRCDRLGGEMIDLSQGHPTDEKHRALYASIRDPYRGYVMLGVRADMATVRSYSVEGFLFDHETMLHNRPEECWEVPKVGKRLARYASFVVAVVLSSSYPGVMEEKLARLQELVSTLRDALDDPPSVDDGGVLDHFLDLERAAYERARESEASAKQYDEYRATLHTHLRTFVNLLTTPPPSSSTDTLLDVSILDYMNRHVFDETFSDPKAKRAA